MYKDDNRGVIQNRIRAKQIRDYSGIRIKNITPTDIDGFIDYKNKKFVFIETKVEGMELPFGQRLALERLCDATTKAGIDSIVFIVEHNTDHYEDIEMAETKLVEYRRKGEWIIPEKNHNLSEAIDMFIGRKND